MDIGIIQAQLNYALTQSAPANELDVLANAFDEIFVEMLSGTVAPSSDDKSQGLFATHSQNEVLNTVLMALKQKSGLGFGKMILAQNKYF